MSVGAVATEQRSSDEGVWWAVLGAECQEVSM